MIYQRSIIYNSTD